MRGPHGTPLLAFAYAPCIRGFATHPLIASLSLRHFSPLGRRGRQWPACVNVKGRVLESAMPSMVALRCVPITPIVMEHGQHC
ncbi:hypothetical protein B5P46_19890 [Rhizobium leguminosarum]|uniref:Uncharacterized protein n=1 Tax=Rhizobium leguminosarum TaxID=384 RepID=A0A4Q1U0J8_RHILE|nr:hypothetical protein B5P46_19890 [Rhizobium leguminosarum]